MIPCTAEVIAPTSTGAVSEPESLPHPDKSETDALLQLHGWGVEEFSICLSRSSSCTTFSGHGSQIALSLKNPKNPVSPECASATTSQASNLDDENREDNAVEHRRGPSALDLHFVRT
ncbi:hypothetical protein NDN08_005385 [Rhodosorus marinus]|uniref:Uncharacterized protein n=1 Tax=Rhodosorus marinus TaxID=101924 RepID=A0AAV8V2D5_9RHOD|nr:hypothetical protein NDN08_005385 [Rhodosorus marinus]